LGKTHYPADILASYPLFYDGVSQVQNPDLFDVINIFYPQSAYLHESLLNWRIPQWDPYSFCGHSLVTNGHSGFYYPPRLLCHLVTPMPWSHDLFLFLHLGLAGLSLFIFCRGIGLQSFPSMFAGVSYQFSGFSVGWFEHEHVLVYCAWTPLILHSYQLALRRSSIRHFCFAAILLGTLGTVGMLQFWAYTLILCGIWGLAVWWRKREISVLFALLASWLAALAVSSIAIWPQLLDLADKSRPVIPWSYQTRAFRELLFSAPLAAWLPDFAGNPAAGFHIQRVSLGGNWIYPESYLYAGLLPLVLAPMAWAFRDRFECRFFAILPLLVVLLCSTPLFLLAHTLVPGLDKTIITRVAIFWPLCLCIVSAYGLQAALTDTRLSVRAGWGAAGLFLVFVTMIASFTSFRSQMFSHWFTQQRVRVPDPQITPEFEAAAQVAFDKFYALGNFSFWWPIVVLLLSLLVLRALPHSKYALWALLALAALDPAAYSLRFNTATPPERLYPLTPEVSFLKARNFEHKSRTMSLAAIRPNTLFAYQLPAFEGDESLYPRATQDYANAMVNRHPRDWKIRFSIKTFPITSFDQRLANLASVNWLVTYPGVEPGPPWSLADHTRLPIFYNPEAIPHILWVPDVLRVTSSEEALETLMSPDWRPGTMVVEATPTGGDPEGSGEPIALEFRRPHGDEIVIAPPASNGWIVWTEGYHPGWTARQGEHLRPVFRANGMFMAVPVQGGEQLTLQFEASGWREGALASGCAVFILALLAWRGNRIRIR
ncbi:MAG: hypothetical protein WC314_04080, partial [Vulcanimicrobiota bacterium]